MSVLFSRRALAEVGEVQISTESERDLRMTFKATKTHDLKKPNTLELQIYNLNEATRGLIASSARVAYENQRNALKQSISALMAVSGVSTPSPALAALLSARPPIPVRLDAGYATEDFGLIFRGLAVTISNVREGSDWVTKIDAADGHQLKDAKVRITSKKGQSMREMLEQSIRASIPTMDSLKVKVKKAADDLRSGKSFSDVLIGTASGLVVNDTMDKAIEKLGGGEVEASVQDGELELFPLGGSSAEEAVLLTPDSGLLGSPEFIHDEKHPTASMLRVKSLLIPAYRIRGRVVVQSREVNATIKLRKIVHTGDTHGGDYVSEIEGVVLA